MIPWMYARIILLHGFDSKLETTIIESLVRIKESSVAVLFLLETFCECKSFDLFGLLFNKQSPVGEFL